MVVVAFRGKSSEQLTDANKAAKAAKQRGKRKKRVRSNSPQVSRTVSGGSRLENSFASRKPSVMTEDEEDVNIKELLDDSLRTPPHRASKKALSSAESGPPRRMTTLSSVDDRDRTSSDLLRKPSLGSFGRSKSFVLAEDADKSRINAQIPYPGPMSQLKGWRYIRQHIYLTFEDQSYTPAAGYLAAFIHLMIFFSVICFILETLPSLECNCSLCSQEGDICPCFWSISETIVSIFFTAEYVIRLLVSRKYCTFVFNFYNMIDLCSFLPWYAELTITCAMNSSIGGLIVLKVLRVVRLTRLIRLLKTEGFRDYLDIFSDTMRYSKPSFGLLVTLMSMVLVVLASVMFFCEKDTMYLDEVCIAQLDQSIALATDESERQTLHLSRADCIMKMFYSIPDAMYWCIVTMTTLGYGDQVPRTSVGKFMASITSIMGLVVLAFPIIIIGGSFDEVYADYLERKTKKALEETFAGQESSDGNETSEDSDLSSGAKPALLEMPSPEAPLGDKDKARPSLQMVSNSLNDADLSLVPDEGAREPAAARDAGKNAKEDEVSEQDVDVARQNSTVRELELPPTLKSRLQDRASRFSRMELEYMGSNNESIFHDARMATKVLKEICEGRGSKPELCAMLSVYASSLICHFQMLGMKQKTKTRKQYIDQLERVQSAMRSPSVKSPKR